MSTPIIDFVKKYADSGISRFHMPGHKGKKILGFENYDITEISGADFLFESEGIIGESEKQTARAFGTAKTLYSTEGSTLCIKTMLGIIRAVKGKSITVAAPRNVHKAFIDGCILLDVNVMWIYPEKERTSLAAGRVTAEDVKKVLEKEKTDCVYITSPTYLGEISDIKSIAEICHKMGTYLIVDNAHGAYLNFLEENVHPINLGADMCCDSAHKTLPCLTGGAYLHISQNAPKEFVQKSKEIMSMFASTSPSYIIMQSLDYCSDYISGNFRKDLSETVKRVKKCKDIISSYGWEIFGQEKMKITINTVSKGISGDDLAEKLREYKTEPEYSDPGFTVLMPSVFNDEDDFVRFENAMEEISAGLSKISAEKEFSSDIIPEAETVLSIREAALGLSHSVKVEEAEGKICGMTVTSCQPSIPVVISGEKITEEIIKILKKYGINRINVL